LYTELAPEIHLLLFFFFFFFFFFLGARLPAFRDHVGTRERRFSEIVVQSSCITERLLDPLALSP